MQHVSLKPVKRDTKKKMRRHSRSSLQTFA
jgi:hypothetical protein